MLYLLIIYCTNCPFLVHGGIDVNSLKSANNIGSIKKLVKYSDDAVSIRDTNLLEGGVGWNFQKISARNLSIFSNFRR